MREVIPTSRGRWQRLLYTAVLGSALATGPAFGADAIDADAADVLKSMSAYLGGTKAFSVNADVDLEIITRNGQKLQISSFATAVLERPARMRVHRKGIFADIEIVFDGKTLTLYGKRLNAYAQLETPGTIDDAVLVFELETGIPAPGADLLFADPYEVLIRGVETGAYIGTTYINGVESHHLAFREDSVDWQIWVQTGDKPLPMKYVITSKWHTGAPQYEIRFRDWNTNPKIDKNEFTFSAPAGAVKLETLALDEMGELTTTQEGKQ